MEAISQTLTFTQVTARDSYSENQKSRSDNIATSVLSHFFNCLLVCLCFSSLRSHLNKKKSYGRLDWYHLGGLLDYCGRRAVLDFVTENSIKLLVSS
ncbi:hypothetical protein K1719_026664 [Acacia pycnantha]|nr:hypothetical protein K1719_026664 [Acacia pycnantha]